MEHHGHEHRDHPEAEAAHNRRGHDAGSGARHGAGHDRHAGHSVAMFRDRFWLTLLLTIPIVVLSHDLQMWLGYEIPTFPGSAYFPAILGTAVFLYGGLVFIRGGRGELADRQPGMMTLISLAILVAFITSWAGTLGLFEVVRVTAVGEQTALSGIMRLVEAAQASSSRAQALADRAAAILFYVALAAGSITLVAWWLLGDQEGALVRAATVLVIACPHALGLAIPLVVAISTSLGASHGLLVKDRLALERARSLDTVIFDKTGTLTRGEPVLVDAAAASGESSSILALAGAVEADSEHPLARAIVEGARRRGIQVPTATNFEALPGRGARAHVEGHEIAVGGPRLLTDLALSPMPAAESWDREGRTVLHVIVDGRVAGAIAAEDEIRPESAEAVAALHRLGVRVAMITGDAQAVAESVARRLGIDEVAAQVLPADKAAAVAKFQARGRKVAMVGDGVNDAPALAQADVGIAIGAGTDVAVESAGIVLVRDDPRDVVGAIELSRATYAKMIQNLVWATGYNLVAIPVAAGVLVPWGIDLPMAVGAVAMSASTIIVAANAQLLRRLRLHWDPVAAERFEASYA